MKGKNGEGVHVMRKGISYESTESPTMNCSTFHKSYDPRREIRSVIGILIGIRPVTGIWSVTGVLIDIRSVIVILIGILGQWLVFDWY